MTEKTIFHSPRICYEIEHKKNAYNINVYFEGFAESEDSKLHCRITNFSCNFEKAADFVKSISSSCALPVHIPELAEEFLSA